MKKIVLSFFAILFCCVCAVAQNQQVTGTVVDSDGNPLTGATAQVKGTNTATVTNLDGAYRINAPVDGVLVFSYVGMNSEEVAIGGKTVINVTMSADATQIEDVVVTAMGMTRQQKTLGYASTTVKNEELTQGKGVDLMTGLMGKVAGVNISQSGGTGSSTKVIVRGYSSIAGSNQPLYVVDGTPITNATAGSFGDSDFNNTIDFGSSANDINPEDVESITVLKGASATALYGSRAANGVIMITTKKGRANEAMSITYDGSFMVTNALRVPQNQKTFGQGWYYSNDGGMGFGVANDYFSNDADPENGSWGPMYDGRTRRWNMGGYYYGEYDSPRYREFTPRGYIGDFLTTGFETNNTVSISGGGQRSGFFASYGNTYSNGYLPGNKDTFKRNTFSFRGNSQVNDYITLNYNINYVRKDIRNAMSGQGSAGSTVYQDVIQIPGDLEMDKIKDYTDIHNNSDNYYTPYSMNPYWIIDNNYGTYQDDRVYGNLELSAQLLPWLKAVGRFGGDVINSREKMFNNIYEFSPTSYNADFGASRNNGSYSNKSNYSEQLDASALLMADKRFGNFSLNATAGWNLNQRTSSYTSGSFTSLISPGWAAFENNNNITPASEYFSRRRLIGLLGQFDFGFKDWAYLTLSARNDWSSTLPINDNSYFYWGVNASAILTDALNIESDVLSFLKVRAAWGTTGNDASVYLTSSPYYYTSAPYSGFADLTFPFNNTRSFNKSTRIPATSLLPEISEEIEFGFDLRMFKNRLSLDFAYYDRNTENQIMSMSVAPESGYSSKIANVGKINNHGIEIALGGTPIQTRNFSWDLNATFAKNWSEVKDLFEGTTSYAVEGVGGYPQLYLEVGEPVGIFKFYDYVTVEDKSSPYYGYKVVGEDGYPLYTTDMVKVGKSAPDFVMGLTNSFRYKDFSLGFTFDWHHGGNFCSSTADLMYFTGNAPETAYNYRDSFVEPFSVVENEDGTYRENNIMVDSYNSMNGYMYSNYNSMAAMRYLLDKSYVKMRDLSLTYHLPKSLFGGFVKGMDISFVGRNLFLWTPKSQNFLDPDSSNFGNDLSSEWGEFYTAPSTRTLGGSIKITF